MSLVGESASPLGAAVPPLVSSGVVVAPLSSGGGVATVREAAKLIARKKHNRLPVVEHGRLVGS